ncbi:hypothetical protein BH23BAC1_BH23BAC1_49200 [soil metagenome]
MINSTTQLAQQAAFEDVLLVYPDGYKNYWNECRKAANSEANLEDINEEAFFNSMIGNFTEKYWISEEKHGNFLKGNFTCFPLLDLIWVPLCQMNNSLNLTLKII